MTEFSYLSPDARRAEVDYRVARITRDYRRLAPAQARVGWWQRRHGRRAQ